MPSTTATPVLPGFTQLLPLHTGSSMEVFSAWQSSHRRPVVIKRPLPALLERPELLAVVLQAQRLALQFEHPRLERVVEVREGRGVPLVICLPIAGGSLSRRMQRPVTAREAVRWIVDIARALDHLHDHGLVHRDVKPANVLLDAAGNAVLVDFGLLTRGVQPCAGTQARRRVEAVFPDGAQAERAAAGTPFYMSPEQASGERLGPASDFYSLGVMLFELLISEPRESPRRLDLRTASHVSRLPSATAWLQPLLDGLLMIDPADRIRSGRVLRQHLEAVLAAAPEARGWLTQDPPQETPDSRLPDGGSPAYVSHAATMVALLLVIAGLLLLRFPLVP